MDRWQLIGLLRERANKPMLDSVDWHIWRALIEALDKQGVQMNICRIITFTENGVFVGREVIKDATFYPYAIINME